MGFYDALLTTVASEPSSYVIYDDGYKENRCHMCDSFQIEPLRRWFHFEPSLFVILKTPPSSQFRSRCEESHSNPNKKSFSPRRYAPPTLSPTPMPTPLATMTSSRRTAVLAEALRSAQRHHCSPSPCRTLPTLSLVALLPTPLATTPSSHRTAVLK